MLKMLRYLAVCSSAVLALMGPAHAQMLAPDNSATRIAVINEASGSTGAVAATLAASQGRYTYLCNFDVSAIGGTAVIGPVTITGLLGGTMTFQASSSAAGATLSRTFTPCLPSSAVNTAIAVTTTADGTATAVNVEASGYYWNFNQ